MKKIVQMRMGSIGLNGTFKKKGKGRDMLQVFSNCGHHFRRYTRHEACAMAYLPGSMYNFEPV